MALDWRLITGLSVLASGALVRAGEALTVCATPEVFTVPLVDQSETCLAWPYKEPDPTHAG